MDVQSLRESWQKVENAFDKYTEDIKGTPIEGYTSILGHHIKQIEMYATKCQYWGLLEHIKEIGEERVGESAFKQAIRAKTMNKSQVEDLEEKTSNMIDAVFDFAAEQMNLRCSCKLTR